MPTAKPTYNFSRRTFIKSAAALAATAALPNSLRAAVLPQKRPNIVFINIDQMTADAISALGCSYVKTPNIDRLFRGGTSFENSYSACPICVPARVSWFTGHPVCETGVRSNLHAIVRPYPNLGRWMKDAGYDSVFIGKSHLSTMDLESSFELIHEHSALGEIGDNRTSMSARGYLKNRSKANPLFLTVGFHNPHDICYPSGFLDLKSQQPGMPSLETLPHLPPNFYKMPQGDVALPEQEHPVIVKLTKEATEYGWRLYNWIYYRLLEKADANVGTVLEALEDYGYTDNTIIIFSVDHGEGLARHKKMAKGFLYDEAARVPLIINSKEFGNSGRQLQYLVSGLDLFPTVCDLAGVKAPDGLRGRSLKGFCEGKNVTSAEFVYSQGEGVNETRMIRTDRYKYICYGEGREQLFDMIKDPWETVNLAMEAKYSADVKTHSKILIDYEKTLNIVPNDELKFKWELRKQG